MFLRGNRNGGPGAWSHPGSLFPRTWDVMVTPADSAMDGRLLATAALSDDNETLSGYWAAWAAVTALVVIMCSVVFLGIVTDRRARSNPFNFYLVYLTIPDLLFSLLCGITCSMNAANNGYWSGWMCRLQYWYVVFGISSNVWLNAAIVRELYTMMKMGHAGRRYRAPTHRTVTLQALGAYLWCGFLGTWGLFVPFVPPGAPSGLACVPIPVGSASTAFFWLVFFPLFSGLPTAYVVYVLVDVLRRKLLPPANTRTRLIITYFVRLVVVFFVMWVPTMVLIFVVPAGGVSPVAHFVGGLWSHLQGAVSAGISLMKPDIYCAVVTLVTCRSWDRSSEDPHCGPSRCGGEGGGGGGTAACTAVGVDCGVGKRPHPSCLLRSFLLSSRNNAEGGSSWGFGFSAAFLGGSRHAAQQRLETSEDSFSPPLAEPGGTTLNPPLVHGESLTLTGNDMAGRDGGGQPRGDPTDVPSPETLSISFASNVAEELGDEFHVVTGGGLCPDGGDGRTSVSSSGLWPSLDETGDADVDDINDTRHCAYDRDDC